MPTREQVVNKLRELGYHFKTDAWRVSIYKKGTHRVEVRKRDFIDDDWVRQAFRQCGMKPDEVEVFIRASKC